MSIFWYVLAVIWVIVFCLEWWNGVPDRALSFITGLLCLVLAKLNDR